MERVLVLGGTGFAGRALCAQWMDFWNAAGPLLNVATRKVIHGRALQAFPTVELIEADIHDDRTLAQLVSRNDAVINLVGILHGTPQEFERVHAQLPRRIAAACEAAGGRRVVHVSALGVAEDAPSHYLRTKWQGELALNSRAIKLTVLRPSVMFGAEDRFLNLFAHLERWLPLTPLACADARFQPVWVDDVAQAIVRCLEQPQTVGRIYDAVGPQVYTLAELVRAAGRWSGHERPVIPLPDTLARAQAWVLEAWPGTKMLSRDNLDSMKVASIASGKVPTLEALGITPTSLDEVAPQYLALTSEERLRAWRTTAHR